MDRRSCILTMVTVACVGLSSRAQAVDPNAYTIPAREQLFLGTLSGLTEAYQILEDGIGDPNVSGDEREMILLHVIARAGMLVFDRNDVSVNTSLLDVAEPFGISVTGDALSPDDPCDPDRVEIHWPIDPNDPNCVRFPPDGDVAAAAVAINTAILPELDSILSELNQVTNSPVFAMILTAAETGDVNDTEIDYGDVLVLKAGLLGAKTLIHSVASPGYNLAIDPNDPLFAGWQCEDLTPSTTIAEVLDAYPNLLEILSGTGAANLAQAKTNLIAALTAVNAALNFMEAETDEQENDLLYVETEEPDYQTLRTELNKFLTSLQSGAAQTYTVESRRTYSLSLDGDAVGQMGLMSGFLDSEEFGYIHLSDSNGLPEWWAIDWFEIDGGVIQGDVTGVTDDYAYWWGWFWGSISADRSQIVDMEFLYLGWPSGAMSGLQAQRTVNAVNTVQFNPNPLFAGTVSLRDILPQFDANTPVVGTMGHGLDDDPTLGGITPGLTQQDWLGTGYEVYGVSDSNVLDGVSLSEDAALDFLHRMDRQPGLATKLGTSSGGSKTFSDGNSYPMYIVAVRSLLLIDSVYGPGSSYLDPNDDEHVEIFNVSAFGDSLDDVEVISAGPVLGAPDGNRVAVGDLGVFGRFTGFVWIRNPDNWTGVTVVTDGAPSSLHDWNGDGIVSIVGDVPPFVQCVYFNDCPDDMDTIAVGDCNGDGILSIVGDVPCFVECVYFSDCP
ncbi:MAG: hypothetical protein ABFD90_02965 [Phycisphaerales bacterium]